MAYRGFARAGDSLDKIISLTHCPYLVGAGSRSTPFFDTSGSVQMNRYTLVHHPLLDHYPIVIWYVVLNRQNHTDRPNGKYIASNSLFRGVYIWDDTI